MDYLRGAIFAGVFMLLLGVERVWPLRIRSEGLRSRWMVNVIMSGLAFLAGFLVVRETALTLTGWTSEHTFGVLHWLKLEGAGQVAAGFLLMDMTFYVWHRANHTINFLWRFHNVHHIDPDMDVTSSFRFHFVEVLFSVGFRCVQVGDNRLWNLLVLPFRRQRAYWIDEKGQFRIKRDRVHLDKKIRIEDKKYLQG